MKDSTEPYKGVRDFYPQDWAKMDWLMSTVRGFLMRAGYEEYNASPLERAELYETKTSEEIVNEQTYTFTDRGDRRVTLRPEMTPTLARMVAAKRRELAFPLRWFSIGNRFRYERPQRGRLREFYQADIDMVGAPEGEADLEILQLSHDLLAAFGATDNDFILRISSRRLLNAACAEAGITGDRASQYIRLLDKKAKMTPEDFRTAASAITATDPLECIAHPASEALQKEKATLDSWLSELSARGITNAVFDPSITRGFDYYTGMVFEVYDRDLANPRALFGGGRYDGLVALYGGDPLPAVGFACGDVTLSDFLETHTLLPKEARSSADLYLGTPTLADIPSAQKIARDLRGKGLRVMVNVMDRGLGDQVRDAVRRAVPFFVALGEQEAKSGTVRLKNLSAESEDAVSLDELPSRVQS